MSSSGRYADVSALLYLVPFALSGVYGLYLWAQTGLSALLPSTVYLAVTRDPYVFMAGSIAIMLGVVLDLRGTEAEKRRAKLTSLGGTLQSVAIASFVLALIAAFYANGVLGVGGAADDFVVGRYGLIFPGIMILLSYLITAKFNFAPLKEPKVLGIIALLLVPASAYEIGKHHTLLGLVIAFILLVVGTAALMYPARKSAAPHAETR